MRFDVVLTLATLLGSTEALRRSCRKAGANDGWYYTVGFDNFNNVAADFCTSPSVLRSWNPNIREVRAGQNLKVPCQAGRKKRDCKKNSALDGAYVVQSGDTLDHIASDFCTNSDTLQSMNSGLIKNKDFIQIGWVIQVPCSWN
ncbi:autolysin (n-acetylmuramoyl-l-alanine amidase) [Colletotrichum truncatum]|uniref:Autolysin (N-acetylmuramoyl-l-alanine amidase) n=1 Tax=Colletotrichum truncatum TaxID=5467 RepID=A0ACC3Z8V0_COLTU|nr:autolysin (n-acetylmuramoyl-l-alanine amidase) [Colletotrichum truncatum]KAF6780943.1 autolysin (n-acetylmuramoyl-l-alanine amidase) [Colletotrichum truncatum]